jgi:hypothetical protein
LTRLVERMRGNFSQWWPMNTIRCPYCDATVPPQEVEGGWCESCGKKLPAAFLPRAVSRREAPADGHSVAPPPSASPAGYAGRPAAPWPYVARRAPNPAVRLLVFLGVVGVIVLGILLYCWLQPPVWIYVDNTDSGAPAVVSLDGSEQTTVAARSVGIVKCWPGTKRVTVVRGGQTVFDQSKTLASQGRSPHKYLVDPSGQHRYRVRTVEYGTSFSFYGGNDDRELAPEQGWMEADYDYVLEREPATVRGNFHETRTVLEHSSR